MKTKFTDITHILLLILVIGLYIYIPILHMYYKKDNSTSNEKYNFKKDGQPRSVRFGGVYEMCEDTTCPDPSTKASCMQEMQAQIKQCCQNVCHAECAHLPPVALEECLSTCER